MRRALVGVMLTVLIVLAAVITAAQTMSRIVVTGSEVNNGVVIVRIQLNGRTHELQCNQGMLSCASLKRGSYTMVELPKNFGVYDCRDVEVYQESPQPAKNAKLGEYCLIEP